MSPDLNNATHAGEMSLKHDGRNAPSRQQHDERETTLAPLSRKSGLLLGPGSIPSEGPPDSEEERYKTQNFFKRISQNVWQNGIKAAFPEAVQDIKIMGGMSALKTRVKLEMKNPLMYPEIQKVAEVRRGLDLGPEELAFIQKRKELARLAFAKYLSLHPDEVHQDDVPIVAFGGSGGGFRAMIGCLGYCAEMKKSGLWDCISYVAGVSGACWAIAAYYKLGHCDMQAVIDHCKKRLSPHHPLSGEAVRAMLSAPGGAKVTLGPLIQKHKTGLDIVAMDYYSVFATGWIFFQGDLAEHPMSNPHRNISGHTYHTWHRLSGLREYIDEGQEPLPILTAIRHQRPDEEWAHKDRPFQDDQHAAGGKSDPPDAWYQWFEMTPYEVGCDEIEAWVPTWGFGRPFSQAKSTMQVPEQSMALLLGLATSAPAAPLTSYLATIDRSLSGFFGTSIRKMAHGVSKMWGKEGTEEFENHHPLHACEEHNFMYEFTPREEGESRQPGLENSKTIQLIDSGMDNNCPTYVLLHPRRETDIIINMDASSDVQKDSFQERVDQIGSRRGLRFTKRTEMKAKEDLADLDRYDGLYAQIYDGVPCERPAFVVDSYGRTVMNPPAPIFPKECTMIYMPLLPNDKVAPGFDPSTTKFSGSYNLVWEPDQVDTLVRVCEANFKAGEETIRMAMREVWQKKRENRLASEHVST